MKMSTERWRNDTDKGGNQNTWLKTRLSTTFFATKLAETYSEFEPRPPRREAGYKPPDP
jgi:hypothetical protein